MSEGLSLSKDKRHRSSSSLAGVLEGTRSERKLDSRDSILEVDEHFSIAEARCNDLQHQIELVRELKRKRKVKKRSMTRLADLQNNAIKNPVLSVRTQPKKKISQQAAQLRRLELPQNPTRGYLDPATVEQHNMIGHVRGYNQVYTQPKVDSNKKNVSNIDVKNIRRTPKRHRGRADEDSVSSREQFPLDNGVEVACGDDRAKASDSYREEKCTQEKRPAVMPKKIFNRRRRMFPKGEILKEEVQRQNKLGQACDGDNVQSNYLAPRRPQPNKSPPRAQKGNDRIVVELFNKCRTDSPPVRNRRGGDQNLIELKSNISRDHRSLDEIDDQTTGPLGITIPKKVHRNPRKVRYRSRGYELPTVASQMKQTGMRYCSDYNSNYANIPFVVSKSTAPSHNIGVNIQQVLNGIKIQQPLSGIPLTIAHHMGLGHISSLNKKTDVSGKVSLEHNRDINAIKVGQRLLRLPSYKYISYNRMLNLYREGDGMVPRFLRSINRPQYFYTSMYNSLVTNREDADGSTSKGQFTGSQEAKQSLAEYSSLYREYEQLDKLLKEGRCESGMEQRHMELSRELAARGDHIRRVVQEFKNAEPEPTPLRASASTAEEGCRHSMFRLSRGDQ